MSWNDERPNHAMERTATRCAFTFSVTSAPPLRATRALSGRRSSHSRLDDYRVSCFLPTVECARLRLFVPVDLSKLPPMHHKMSADVELRVASSKRSKLRFPAVFAKTASPVRRRSEAFRSSPAPSVRGWAVSFFLPHFPRPRSFSYRAQKEWGFYPPFFRLVPVKVVGFTWGGIKPSSNHAMERTADRCALHFEMTSTPSPRATRGLVRRRSSCSR